MKLFQSYLAILGIFCAIIWLGCEIGDDDDDVNNEVEAESATPPLTWVDQDAIGRGLRTPICQ